MRDVFIIDRRLSSREGPWARHARELTGTGDAAGMVVIVSPDWTMQDICDEIVAFAQDGGLGNLHLCGHGRDRGDHNTFLQLGSDPHGLTETNAQLFRALRPHWNNRHAYLFVHACYSASLDPPQRRNEVREDFRALHRNIAHGLGVDSLTPLSGTRPAGVAAPGDRVFQALANHAGVTVVASPDEQLSDRQFHIEGRAIFYRSQDPVATGE